MDINPSITVRVDLSLKIQQIVSGNQDFTTIATNSGEERGISSESLDMVDWQDIYIRLLEHNGSKGYSNLVVQPDIPRRIVETGGLYQLFADASVLKPRSFAEVSYLQDAVAAIVLKYAEKFYSVRQGQWESNNMTYSVLNETDTNFRDYTIRIPRDDAVLD